MVTVAVAAFIGIAVAAMIVGLVWRRLRAKEKMVQAAFFGREPLTPEMFYERYFLGLGVAREVVVGIRSILEEQLGADMSCLRAEDDFSRNLSFFWDFDSMASVEVVLAIEEHFRIDIADAEVESTYTVLDLVYLVSRKSTRWRYPGRLESRW